METSAEIKDIATALSKAQAVFPDFKKNRTVKVTTKTGANYAYKYTELSEIIKGTTPVLSANGLTVIQGVDNTETKVIIITMLLHSTGQFFKTKLELPLLEENKNVIQSIGSTISYGRRYSLSALLNIASESDDDGNSAGDGHKVATGSQQNGNAPGNGNKPDNKGFAPPCPKCGNSISVIHSKEEWGGGFCCYKPKSGCGHTWGGKAKADTKPADNKESPTGSPGTVENPQITYVGLIGQVNSVKNMNDVQTVLTTITDAVKSNFITTDEGTKAVNILEKIRVAKKIQ